jgi:O-antigen/teichoic acid export membrane protein
MRIKLSASAGCSAPYEIFARIRRHFVGRVGALVAATAFHVTLSVALLPLATRQLGAADYGTYGLLMSIVTLVGAALDGGAGLLVPAHYGPASASERAGLFATLAFFAGTASGAAGLFLILLWTWQDGIFASQVIPLAAIVVSAALMPLRAITNISILTFSVSGRSPAIAAQMAVQSLVVFLSTLAALFAFALDGTSLFIGALCGQCAALCVALVALGRQHTFHLPSRDWFRRVATSAPTTAASGLVTGTRGFGENALLTSAMGLHAVGVLTHARLYHGLVMALSNAVGHNVWANSLDEARNPRSAFKVTQSAWTPVQIIIACIGIIFAFLGEEIVDIVSNGKFAEAAAYIPALFIIALIQTTEQPASAVVCASSRAARATWTRTILGLGAFLILFPTIALFGIKGVIAICLIEGIAFRCYLRILASRERKVPSPDHVAVFGCFGIIAGMAYIHWTSPPLIIKLCLIALGIAMLLAIGRRSINEMMLAGRQMVLGERYNRALFDRERCAPLWITRTEGQTCSSVPTLPYRSEEYRAVAAREWDRRRRSPPAWSSRTGRSQRRPRHTAT